MTTDLTVVKGDYGYTLNFTITNNGVAYNITGGTVLFKYRLRGSSSTVSKTCSLLIPENGTCSYTVANTDFSVAGIYEWELEATVGSKVLTHKGSNIVVVDEL